MNKRNNRRHTVDMLFVLTLFGVFAVCASLLIAFGANIYQSTVDRTNEHYTLSTASSFITQKVHQHDESGCVRVGEYGDGPAFMLYEEIGDTRYCNYLYTYDGYLKELFIPEGSDVVPSSGQNILPVSAFTIVHNNMYTDSDGTQYVVSLADKSGKKIDFTVFVRSSY